MGRHGSRRYLSAAIIVVTVLGLTLAVTMTSASAGTRITAPAITGTPTSGPPGTSVTIKGSGFAKNTTVRIIFTNSAHVKTVVATKVSTGATGSFTKVVVVPATSPKGEGHFTAFDKLALQKATAPFRVT